MACAGAVSLAVLNFYINAMGGKLKFGLLMSWFLLVEAARVGATVWLSHWTDTVDAPGGAPHGPLWYLMIYTIISAVQVSTPPSSLKAALPASLSPHDPSPSFISSFQISYPIGRLQAASLG